MASEVKSDLGNQLSGLDYICSHVFLASKCFHELNETEEVKWLQETSIEILKNANIEDIGVLPLDLVGDGGGVDLAGCRMNRYATWGSFFLADRSSFNLITDDDKEGNQAQPLNTKYHLFSPSTIFRSW